MTVYGTLMNFKGEHEALAAQMGEAPYKAPPKAPVLYVKTANTFTSNGATIPVPARVSEVEVGATLGAVVGAGGKVVGYQLMNDLSIPHASFFRPPVKFKCLDGFLGIGSETAAIDPAQAVVEVRINGELKQAVRFADLVRPAGQLMADVTDFMTLAEGDVLMLGCDWGRPRARVGDRIEISAAGLGTLANTLVAEAA
jgi:5-oxopent-3-ene-1,2,5-tricarboxylate decarboxylase / 2-hydroxyhepta-2,4-diene-1,7-dioate isomerase